MAGADRAESSRGERLGLTCPAVTDTEPKFARPRLSERALPRLHFVDGRCRVLLHDVETGDVVEIGPREWVLLAGADGSRDLEGILLSANAREGVMVSAEALSGLLDGVRRAGMLADGPKPRKKTPGEEGAAAARAPGEAAEPPAESPATPKEQRPIERLPGYSFHCDGHGSCCRLYSTVVFSPLEVARARSLRPDVLDCGEREEHAFMPVRGTGGTGGEGAGLAVAIVDGRCAFLEGSLCALHKAGGPKGKPLGCNLFPLALVDDGTRVRASVSVECSCVLASVGKPGGDPILAESVRVRGDVDPALVLDDLPAWVQIAGEAHSPRADYVRWSDAALEALDGAEDAARAAWALADALAAHGFDVERARAAIVEPPPVDLDLCGRHLAALADKASRRAKAQQAYRNDADLCRRGVAVIAAGATLLADRDVLEAVTLGAGAAPTDEAFYLRVALFGHQMVGYPLVTSLRDRAVAMWVARTFPLAADALYPGEKEPAFLHPIALVEALFRGHGLRRYTDEIQDTTTAGR